MKPTPSQVRSLADVLGNPHPKLDGRVLKGLVNQGWVSFEWDITGRHPARFKLTRAGVALLEASLDQVGDSAIIRRKSRSTGTQVALYLEGEDHPDGKWSTICETHGGVVHHETRDAALASLGHPELWCPYCMGDEPVEESLGQ
jgi:hypothetical protein